MKGTVHGLTYCSSGKSSNLILTLHDYHAGLKISFGSITVISYNFISRKRMNL